MLQGSVANSPQISLANLNLEAYDIEADYSTWAESSSFGRKDESDYVLKKDFDTFKTEIKQEVS